MGIEDAWAGYPRTAFAERSKQRAWGIQSRERLSQDERSGCSERIVQRILDSEAYRNAKTILIYRAVRGEVDLHGLTQSTGAVQKRFVYPRCMSKTELAAFLPNTPDAWGIGKFGIPEPIPEESLPVLPEEIDLVLCPCTAFDANCNRMGMGAGYYDRYIERCVNAFVAAVAFEAQRADAIMQAAWDRPMQAVFTESRVYTR